MKSFDTNKVVAVGYLNNESYQFNVSNITFVETSISIRRKSAKQDILDTFIVHIPLSAYEKIDIDKKVKIIGEVRTYAKIVDEKRHLKLLIFCKSISNIDEEDQCNVELSGKIIKKQLIRLTASGKVIRDLIILSNYSPHKSAYIPTIAWDRTAEDLKTTLVGTFVSTAGVLHSRKYTKKEEVDETIKMTEKIAYEYSINSFCEVNNEQNDF